MLRYNNITTILSFWKVIRTNKYIAHAKTHFRLEWLCEAMKKKKRKIRKTPIARQYNLPFPINFG